jgi:hypothetical protein
MPIAPSQVPASLWAHAKIKLNCMIGHVFSLDTPKGTFHNYIIPLNPLAKRIALIAVFAVGESKK